jgi:hypothetical protein
LDEDIRQRKSHVDGPVSAVDTVVKAPMLCFVWEWLVRLRLVASEGVGGAGSE